MSRRQSSATVITGPFVPKTVVLVDSYTIWALWGDVKSINDIDERRQVDRVILKSARSACRRCPPPARTSKSAGSPRSARTTIGGDRIKGRTGMCELLRCHGLRLPAG